MILKQNLSKFRFNYWVWGAWLSLGNGMEGILGWKGAPLTPACVWPSRQPRGQLDPCPLHEEEALPLHQVSDAGTGEGVSLQYVFNQGPSV